VGRHADLRLVKRVLTPRERLLVQISTDPDRMLWSLWAAKEAAYKALSRTSRGLRFSPAAFEMVPDPQANTFTVTHDGWSIPVRWDQSPDWVHAVAADGPAMARVEANAQLFHVPSDESASVRALAVRLAAEAGWGPGTIAGQPPVFQGSGSPRLVSLSHDGPYVAACLGL